MKKTSLLLCVLLLTGCANEKVSYVPENTSENMEITTDSGFESKEEVASLDSTDAQTVEENIKEKIVLPESGYAGIKWNDNIEIEDDQGKKRFIDISVDTVCEIPAEELSIVEGTLYKLSTEENKKKIINTLLGDSPVYRYEEEYLTAEFIEQRIKYYEYLKETYNDDDEYYQSIIDADKKLLLTAPTDYTPIEDYSCNRYLGIIEDVPFFIIFEPELSREIYTENNKYIIESEGCKCRIDIPACYSYFMINDNFSFKTDIVALYEQILAQFEVFEYTEENNTRNYYQIPNIKFIYSGGGPIRTKKIKDANGDEKVIYVGNIGEPATNISLDSKFLTVVNPIAVDSVTKDIIMLSFKDIADIVIDELSRHYSNYSTYDSIKVSSMELGYAILYDEDTNKVYYVPCWAFGDAMYGEIYEPIVVNAIDGTIIDYCSNIVWDTKILN